MLRLLTVTVFAATLVVTGVLYKLKYDTRALQLETVQLRQQIEAERDQVAVLKAEWSMLTQPERVDLFADSLGLKPLSPKQIVSFHDIDSIPLRDDGSVSASRQDFGKDQGNGKDQGRAKAGAVRKIGFKPLDDANFDGAGLYQLIEAGEVRDAK